MSQIIYCQFLVRNVQTSNLLNFYSPSPPSLCFVRFILMLLSFKSYGSVSKRIINGHLKYLHTQNVEQRVSPTLLPVLPFYIHIFFHSLCFLALYPGGQWLTKKNKKISSCRSCESVCAHKHNTATSVDADTHTYTHRHTDANPWADQGLSTHSGGSPAGWWRLGSKVPAYIFRSMADLPTSHRQADQRYTASSPAEGTAPSCLLNAISV